MEILQLELNNDIMFFHFQSYDHYTLIVFILFINLHVLYYVISNLECFFFFNKFISK